MHNRSGKSNFEDFIKILPLIVLGIILIGLIFVDWNSERFDLIPTKENFQKPAIGFDKVLESENFVFMNYVFGKIPGHLLDTLADSPGDSSPEREAGKSSAIVIVATWFVFFLIFGDIMSLFGGFSKSVNWVVAFLLTIVGANIKLISVTFVYFLTILSVFGSFAIMASIAFIFFLFVMFHFGSTGMRRWVIMRRAEDQAMKAVAGGKKAAGGIQVLKDIVDEAARGQ